MVDSQSAITHEDYLVAVTTVVCEQYPTTAAALSQVQLVFGTGPRRRALDPLHRVWGGWEADEPLLLEIARDRRAGAGGDLPGRVIVAGGAFGPPLRAATAYRGLRTAAGCVVTRPDGTPLPLAVRRHSPTGFEWGFGGSGPAQLALALLLDVGVGAAVALDHYQALKAERVQRWRGPGWALDADELAIWLGGRGCTVMICPTGEPHDWIPEWLSSDTWHGGTEYRSRCRRCRLQRSRIEGAPEEADTWSANGTSYYTIGTDDAAEAAP